VLHGPHLLDVPTLLSLARLGCARGCLPCLLAAWAGEGTCSPPAGGRHRHSMQAVTPAYTTALNWPCSPVYMVGNGTFYGYCMESCGYCDGEGEDQVRRPFVNTGHAPSLLA